MRGHILLLAAAAALSAGAAQAASVEIRDAVVRVTVVPEARGDVRVEVVRPNGKLPLAVRSEAGVTIIDGDLHRRIRNCSGSGERASVHVRGVGKVRYADMPQVVIHTPRDVKLAADGAVSGLIGRSGSVELANSGCSNWTLADAAGDVSIHESGAGSVRMGQADRLTVRLSGAGSVHATRIRRGMDARLSGAGGVNVDEFDGALSAQVSGVGKVNVDAGRASSLEARVSGVGGVEFDGVVGDLDASISGFGGVKVKSVTGNVRKSVSGIGKVTIADRS